jgi:hypothetical protein
LPAGTATSSIRQTNSSPVREADTGKLQTWLALATDSAAAFALPKSEQLYTVEESLVLRRRASVSNK